MPRRKLPIPSTIELEDEQEPLAPEERIWTAKPLELGAAGDVVAARRFVEVLFESVEEPPSHPLTRLLLTAVTLDLNARIADEPYLQDVVEALIILFQEERARGQLCTHPLALIQYVGLELRQISEGELVALFSPLIVEMLMIPQPRRRRAPATIEFQTWH